MKCPCHSELNKGSPPDLKVNHQLLLAIDTLPSQAKEISRPKKLEELEKNFLDSVGHSLTQDFEEDLTRCFKLEILQKTVLEAK